MSRPRLLDLFCGAGGAAMGYHRAGFNVVGVDIKPQPHYPFEFHQGDALEYPLDGFDVIHASPPCQAYSIMSKRNGTSDNHPRLIESVREKVAGKVYVIENVPGAPLNNPIILCGSMFGLRVKRHRLFESGYWLLSPSCDHACYPKDLDVLNHGRKKTRFVPVYGSTGGKAPHLWATAMGIDWMPARCLAEAIPPAYTEFIGRQLMSACRLWGGSGAS